MDKVFSLVRKMYGYSPNDEMEGISVNGATWSIFMSATLRAALTLGNNYTEILTTIKTEKSLRQLFHITQDLVLEQTETTGITTIDWEQANWRATTLLSDKAVKKSAKTCVPSDSALCL